jgi:hypothetical protein
VVDVKVKLSPYLNFNGKMGNFPIHGSKHTPFASETRNVLL